MQPKPNEKSSKVKDKDINTWFIHAQRFIYCFPPKANKKASGADICAIRLRRMDSSKKRAAWERDDVTISNDVHPPIHNDVTRDVIDSAAELCTCVIYVYVLASCLIYARALLENVIFISWVHSFSKMLPSVKFAEDKVLV